MSVLGVTTATRPQWIAWLRHVGACADAIAWCETQPNKAAAWRNCERGDWMLWAIGKTVGPPGDDSRKPLVMAACECARLALPYLPAGEQRPLAAIETAEAWCRGDATLNQVRAAASYAAYAYAAAAPAYAYAAHVAAAAAAAAYAAYATYADADARTITLRQCADIVRKHFPKPPRVPRQPVGLGGEE